ncbi:PaaI family thioesterase [Burkholderia sp. Ac-20345]|uniref:PaaI family thioesterase n=1 Tax=Burkholderia sp. Ac-20345 TaxID=2703891 RepID=UPI00197B4A6E|nr:PaaI family thioesterase [Burkholderia sp. Ac-20345]MBN3779000.1 PaaI family thioesterase [Burkholderia sp. Ac-20345]
MSNLCEVSDAHLRIDSAFCLDHGFELIGHGDGWAEIACEVRPRHANRRGNVHGGLIAALLDTSMGLATRASGDVENLGTASLNVSYLQPARGRLVASGSVLRNGRKLAFCEATVRNADGEIVATASGVFAITHRAAISSSTSDAEPPAAFGTDRHRR